ncbi:hypothetical protein ACSBL2_02640 [Pedobacter sp. AW31-3R]|uniref:hypothetical protein n=1 Tax=Pedobacter sp. AW31-3R TaxID=3445781 RepID=UPI003F9FC970
MNMLKRLLMALLFAMPVHIYAQTGVSGGVFDYENKNFPLQKVTVRNLNNKKIVLTGAAGQFTIQANKGDLLELSLPGYHTDTLYLTDLQSKTIYLPVSSTDLKEVKIRSAKLSRDLNLKNPTNAQEFKRVSGIRPTQNVGRAGGVGIAFGGGKAKREKAKEKALEVKDFYESEINKYFSEEHVNDLIKLEGQDLKDFINMYKPSVALVKGDELFNYDFYIAEAYQKWLKLSPAQRKGAPMPKLNKN